MSQYGSHNALSMNMSTNRRAEPTTGGSFRYTRGELAQGAGNGYDHFVDSYHTVTKSSAGVGAMAGDTIGRMTSMTGGAIWYTLQKAFRVDAPPPSFLHDSCNKAQ